MLLTKKDFFLMLDRFDIKNATEIEIGYINGRTEDTNFICLQYRKDTTERRIIGCFKRFNLQPKAQFIGKLDSELDKFEKWLREWKYNS